MNTYWILFGLFLLIFLAWLGLSTYVIVNRLRYERRNKLLHNVVSQLGTSRPLMLTAKTRSELVRPVITRLPQPMVYRAATDVAVYSPVAEVFAVHALQRWGASVFAAAAEARPDVDRWQRISALSILTRARADCVHDLLFNAISDKDPDVASNAVVLLGKLQDVRAAELLVLALHSHLYLPSFIARQLDNFTIPLDGLLEPLLDSDDVVIRYWAVMLLGGHGKGGELHAQKIANLAGDPYPMVRKAVAQTLGILKATSEAPAVLRLLYDDVAFVRLHAIKALARINYPDFSGSLIAMLEDPVWQVRLAAREALSTMEQRPPECTDQLHERLTQTDVGDMNSLQVFDIDRMTRQSRAYFGSGVERL